MLLTNFLFKCRTTIFLKTDVSLAFHMFEQYLECKKMAMALPVLTVKAEGSKKMIQDFLVGMLLHRDYVLSHRVLHDNTLSFFDSSFKISLRSRTDSSVSLALKYS